MDSLPAPILTTGPKHQLKDIINISLTFILLLSLPIVLYLSRQTQDIRQRAQETSLSSVMGETLNLMQSTRQELSVPDEILIKFKPGVPEAAKENIRDSHGIKVEEAIEQIDVERGKVPAVARDKIIEALSNNPNIEYAEPNYIGESLLIPNDPEYPKQWALPKISAPGGWDISTGSSSVVVAVIDTGVYAPHEDLQGKLVPGYNFYDNNTDTTDILGHGTAVSGVIGATTNNNKGIAAVAWQSPTMPLRDTDAAGSYLNTNQARAITYAADNSAKVINLSQGGYSPCSSTVQDAVNYAWTRNVVIVAAAGNDPARGIAAPANCNNVVAAGATDQNDNKASFSSTGQALDAVAPGVSIYTTCDPTKQGTFYCWAQGTSFASPHTAGLAALIFSANPSLTNQQVVDIITSTADDLGTPGWDDQYGWGRINAYKALLSASGGTPPPPSPTPTIGPTNTPTPTAIPDTIPPTITINTTQPLIIASKGNTRVPVTASDSSGISSIQIFLDSKLLKTCSGVTTCTANINGSKTSTGTHTITATATDNSPSRNTATTSITAVKQ